MVDRLTGKPLHLDISDLPMKRGITTNRNKFVLGPSGSGKSFFMNHLVRQYYEQGTHAVSYTHLTYSAGFPSTRPYGRIKAWVIGQTDELSLIHI